VLNKLIKLAQHLDSKGLYKEADYVDWMVKKEAKKKYPAILFLAEEALSSAGENESSERLRSYYKNSGDMDFYRSMHGARDGLRAATDKNKFGYDYLMSHLDEVSDLEIKRILSHAAALMMD